MASHLVVVDHATALPPLIAALAEVARRDREAAFAVVTVCVPDSTERGHSEAHVNARRRSIHLRALMTARGLEVASAEVIELGQAAALAPGLGTAAGHASIVWGGHRPAANRCPTELGGNAVSRAA